MALRGGVVARGGGVDVVLVEVLRGGETVWEHVLLLVEGRKLWLDGGGVDTVLVETNLNLRRNVEELVGGNVHFDVERGNEQLFGEVPDMNIVNGKNAWDFEDVFNNVSGVNGLWGPLQKNSGGGFAQGKGRGKDDAGNNKRHQGVRVESPGVVSFPNEEGSNNNTNVTKGITKHVEVDALHVH